jgi:hypothetical protein
MREKEEERREGKKGGKERREVYLRRHTNQ